MQRPTQPRYRAATRCLFLSLILPATICCWSARVGLAAERLVLDKKMHHLRAGGPREWTEFPAQAENSTLELTFSAKVNASEQTLRLRQEDVKQQWVVALNNKQLGKLRVDENHLVACFPIPSGTLVDGRNTLRIHQQPRGKMIPDDIRVGDVFIDPRAMGDMLGESTMVLEVSDDETDKPLPARFTVIHPNGALAAIGTPSNAHLAVRPGIVYTSTGRAQIRLPAGRYTVYAGRGFEYSLDKETVETAAGQSTTCRLAIDREVSTPGYVACDTHIHTLTHSGHGDATVQERMVTLAGEGIELPIATDHNVHINHLPYAFKQDVEQYFTPVIGNEVTTSVGHFNIFPVARQAKPPNHKLTDWKAIFADIYRTPDVKVVILNHGRDLHAGTRPLGPKLHNGLVGENLENWPPGMNAMEVVNSAATQTDIMQLFHDWMGLLNRGRSITPVGSSDSHDVGRHFVGQGRTYVRCDDRDPGELDVDQAVENFVAGKVMVSYGLLAQLTINDKYGSGELVRLGGDTIDVRVEVLGPHWVQADQVQLYANGQLIREKDIRNRSPWPGEQWTGGWTIPAPKHDVHLVAIATGPGVDGLYWKTAKPYQPTSPKWRPQVVGCSGAVWLDADGDGRRTSARDYAERLYSKSQGEPAALLDNLSGHDRAVALQVAHLYQSSDQSWLSPAGQAALKRANGETRSAVQAYLDAWRTSQIARQQR